MSIICAPAGVIGSASPSADLSLIGIITNLGLTTNLKLCLDAGDANSYDPGVQTAKWLDTSGNGYDFYRGTSTGGDGAEPTFNGSAGGLSSSEYWSFDGGDYFSYDSANEVWMNALHNDGAVWSAFAVIYAKNTTTSMAIFGTAAGAVIEGASLIRSSTNALIARYSTASAASTASADAAVSNANTWAVLGFGVNENGGATGSAYITKNGSGTWNGANSLASSASPGGDCTIGAFSNKTIPLHSDARIACLAVWEGTALTGANLTALYDAIKGRFGL